MDTPVPVTDEEPFIKKPQRIVEVAGAERVQVNVRNDDHAIGLDEGGIQQPDALRLERRVHPLDRLEWNNGRIVAKVSRNEITRRNEHKHCLDSNDLSPRPLSGPPEIEISRIEIASHEDVRQPRWTTMSVEARSWKERR